MSTSFPTRRTSDLLFADAGGEAKFALTGAGEAARLDLIAPALTSASGAYVTGDDDSRIGRLFAASRPAMVAAGGWRFGGGDLPTGSLTHAARADGSVGGEARFIDRKSGAEGKSVSVRVGLGGGRSLKTKKDIN